jgi:hypothetical protein
VDAPLKGNEPARISSATVTTSVSHFAIAEALDGTVVDWMLQVSEQEYARAADAQ